MAIIDQSHTLCHAVQFKSIVADLHSHLVEQVIHISETGKLKLREVTH